MHFCKHKSCTWFRANNAFSRLSHPELSTVTFTGHVSRLLQRLFEKLTKDPGAFEASFPEEFCDKPDFWAAAYHHHSPNTDKKLQHHTVQDNQTDPTFPRWCWHQRQYWTKCTCKELQILLFYFISDALDYKYIFMLPFSFKLRPLKTSVVHQTEMHIWWPVLHMKVKVSWFSSLAHHGTTSQAVRILCSGTSWKIITKSVT